jgi:hypothetical protein
VTKVYAPAAPSNGIVVYVTRVQYVPRDARAREIHYAFLFDTNDGNVIDMRGIVTVANEGARP